MTFHYGRQNPRDSSFEITAILPSITFSTHHSPHLYVYQNAYTRTQTHQIIFFSITQKKNGISKTIDFETDGVTHLHTHEHQKCHQNFDQRQYHIHSIRVDIIVNSYDNVFAVFFFLLLFNTTTNAFQTSTSLGTWIDERPEKSFNYLLSHLAIRWQYSHVQN